MEKVLSKILISVFMVSLFLAPVGLIVKEKNISISINETRAQSTPGYTPPATNGNSQTPVKPSYDFNCGIIDGEIIGCVAFILYYAVWSPLSFFAEMSGHFLDFFIFYSTNSSSYDKGFINLAWSAVRDIANLFFIISLLYVAIQTILGLGHHGKSMIKNIIIIALIINFSLFFTKVVIDSTNILTKVFYNNITVKNEIVEPGKPKSLSVGLVSIFDPQSIISKDAYKQTDSNGVSNIGLFIFVTLLSAAIMAFMVYIFISCGLLFVARVAGLWLAMIFSPIAFASYAMPFDIPGLGHKKWWDDLLKQAFLGPIFVFFLYVIFLFGDLLKIISSDYQSTGSITEKMMTTIVPFALIYVLLQRAKKMAVDFSGEIGSAVNKAGATIGGFALGAVTGGAALLGSSTIGKYAASKVANADWQEKAGQRGMTGFMYRTALKTANYGSKATFDARKSPLGDLAAKGGLNLDKGTGVLGLGGKDTAGGFKGVAERKEANIKKEMDLYKTKMTDKEVDTFTGGRLTTAAELNEERMKRFKENIGKTGILYSTSHSIAKVTSEKGTSAEDLDKLAKKWKMAIGGGAAVLTGGVAGGYVGSLLGSTTIGAVAGGAVGGATAYGSKVFDDKAEKLAEKSIEKEIEKAKKLADELRMLKADEKKLSGIFEKTTKDAGGLDNYDSYVETTIEGLTSELQTLKDRSNELAKLRASLSTLSKIAPYGGVSEYEKAEKRINDLSSTETTDKVRATTIVTEKAELNIAKNAKKELSRVRSRMDNLNKANEHKSDTKDRKIAEPSASASHAPADDHKADGGGAHAPAAH